jgi:predicted anti-sigma-YlaC factor YlaD
MECATAREIISARLDGEADDREISGLVAHVAECAACRTFETRVLATRRSTVAVADNPPDLAPAILARIASEPRPRLSPVPRAGLIAAALLEGVLAIQALVARSAHGHEVHRHVAFMYLALAVGFAFVAYRPLRSAAGVAPVAAVLVVCVLVSAALDVIGGAAGATQQLVHIVCVTGLAATVWFLRPVRHQAAFPALH